MEEFDATYDSDEDADYSKMDMVIKGCVEEFLVSTFAVYIASTLPSSLIFPPPRTPSGQQEGSNEALGL